MRGPQKSLIMPFDVVGLKSVLERQRQCHNPTKPSRKGHSRLLDPVLTQQLFELQSHVDGVIHGGQCCLFAGKRVSAFAVVEADAFEDGPT